MGATTKYNAYFDIDDNYFPQINDSTIAEGEKQDPDFWMRTYPHPTFIGMLKNLEKSLDRTEKKTLWIEGSYGTGKSQCAYALRRILEAPEEKLRQYWASYEPLSKHVDLLNKLCGHKERKIVTVYRYSSSGIDDDQKFFRAIQESVLNALKKTGCSYLGSNTLKDSVVAWLGDQTHKNFFNDLLKTKYTSRFSQRSCEEILQTLNGGGSVDETMENVLHLAEQEGITALKFDVDSLCAWLRDVVNTNGVKIVFVWDEFSDYLKTNKKTLSGFQKTVELCGEIPFFFVPVTHETDHIFDQGDKDWKKIRDRFLFSYIALPDNVALDLIGHGLKVKQERRYDWKECADDLNSRLSSSRTAVAKAAKIDNSAVMERILPIHPMTAFVLKHLTERFQSNQRSMFDFIKTSDPDVKAFQWYIENYGPEDATPLLTVDMLWNFFYECNQHLLDSRIRGVLDGYEKRQANLREDEKAVLKATLILQALDEITDNRVEILHPNDKNLALVFDGVTSLNGSRSGNLAAKMAESGILFKKPLLDKTVVYAVEINSGDANQIEKNKKKIREDFSTSKAINDGELKNALALTPPLRLRFEETTGYGYITPTSDADFKNKTRDIRERPIENWKFKAIVCFASAKSEADSFHIKIREEASSSQNKEIVFIDATSTVLSETAFEDYVTYAANAEYYQKSDLQASREHDGKARQILTSWRDSFLNGRFVVYYNGESWNPSDLQGLRDVLQEIVVRRFNKAFDFIKGLTEAQMKKTQPGASALCGINQKTSGVVVGVEKKLFPSGVWNEPVYWENNPDADISQIKIAVDRFVESGFKRDGQVSINRICDMLEEKYGFARCNLYSFLTGFLLKEYGLNNLLRYKDANGAQDVMSPEKLSEALGGYLGGKHKQEMFIVTRTSEEREFYKIVKEGWDASPKCDSIADAASAVNAFLNKRGYPLQFVQSVVPEDAYNVALKFLELCKSRGDEQIRLVNEIGSIGLKISSIGVELKEALSEGNFIKGAETYLRDYDGGKLWSLTEEIGAKPLVDVKERFKVKYHSLWETETQEDEIRKLEVEYEFVKEVDALFNLRANSKGKALEGLRDACLNMPVSCETLKREKSSLQSLLDRFLEICKRPDLLPDVLESTLKEIVENREAIQELWSDKVALCNKIYKEYLEDISEKELQKFVDKASQEKLFEKSENDCNRLMERWANETRRNQRKEKLRDLWKEATQTSNPREWSKKHKTPILCLVDDDQFENAKRTFEIVCNPNPNDQDVQQAMLYLEEKPIFSLLNDETRRRGAFEEKVLKTKPARKLLSYEKVVAELEKRYPEVYDWYPNPNVDRLIQETTEKVYYAGGYQKACDVAEKMSPEKAKEYLCRLLKENVKVGLEILADLED